MGVVRRGMSPKGFLNPRACVMLYTLASLLHQADRIRLYPSAEVICSRGGGRSIVGVSVRFVARDRRVVPLWTDPAQFDPAWTTPAELHADGSVTAKGPIPGPLFVDHPGVKLPEIDRPRLLIVEDHAPTRNTLLAILAGKGWDVVAVGTLADGITRLDPPPECIVLDLMLPDGDGETILRWVRQRRLPTRVTVYSATCELVRLNAVLELRPDALLTKPIDLASLCRALESQLADSRGEVAFPTLLEDTPPPSGETEVLPRTPLRGEVPDPGVACPG